MAWVYFRRKSCTQRVLLDYLSEGHFHEPATFFFQTLATADIICRLQHESFQPVKATDRLDKVTVLFTATDLLCVYSASPRGIRG